MGRAPRPRTFQPARRCGHENGEWRIVQAIGGDTGDWRYIRTNWHRGARVQSLSALGAEKRAQDRARWKVGAARFARLATTHWQPLWLHCGRIRRGYLACFFLHFFMSLFISLFLSVFRSFLFCSVFYSFVLSFLIYFVSFMRSSLIVFHRSQHTRSVPVTPIRANDPRPQFGVLRGPGQQRAAHRRVDARAARPQRGPAAPGGTRWCRCVRSRDHQNNEGVVAFCMAGRPPRSRILRQSRRCHRPYSGWEAPLVSRLRASCRRPPRRGRPTSFRSEVRADCRDAARVLPKTGQSQRTTQIFAEHGPNSGERGQRQSSSLEFGPDMPKLCAESTDVLPRSAKCGPTSAHCRIRQSFSSGRRCWAISWAIPRATTGELRGDLR